MKYIYNLFLIIICSLFLTGCFSDDSDNITEVTGSTMGITFSVKIAQELKPEQLKELNQTINGILISINSQMSTYIRTSELSRLNLYSGEWFTLSPETFEVIEYAMEVADKTAGAYDISAGGLVNLWGFGPKGDKKVPSAADIYEAKQHIGYRNIEMNKEMRQIKKFFSKTYIDLSSIAKGYAVDRVSNYLSNRGYQNHLVEIGGELITKGKKGEKNWLIGIESPVKNKKELNIIIDTNKELALATSGNYRNYYEEEGKSYSHTIDPRTGKPVTHKLLSVSVLSQTCMKSDAWATALMVLGPEKGFEAAENEGLAAYFIFEDESGMKSKMTKLFKELLPPEKKSE